MPTLTGPAAKDANKVKTRGFHGPFGQLTPVGANARGRPVGKVQIISQSQVDPALLYLGLDPPYFGQFVANLKS